MRDGSRLWTAYQIMATIPAAREAARMVAHRHIITKYYRVRVL